MGAHLQTEFLEIRDGESGKVVYIVGKVHGVRVHALASGIVLRLFNQADQKFLLV